MRISFLVGHYLGWSYLRTVFAGLFFTLIILLLLHSMLSLVTNHNESNTRPLRRCRPNLDLSAVWLLPKQWLREDALYSDHPEGLNLVLEALNCATVVEADVAKVGTQFKLLLTLDGGQKVLFKPKWYERDHVIKGTIYDGKDRHNGEIFGFYLNLVLGFRRTPPVAGRVLNWETEILPVATRRLRNTVFTKGQHTCVTGECYYCTKAEAFCFDSAKPEIEGALIIWLPDEVKLRRLRSPWARTYKAGRMARWEYLPKYCTSDVLPSPLFAHVPGGINEPQRHELFLDFIDAAIFDYLMLNGDRHRYELRPQRGPRNGTVILMDNGKSFGNPAWSGYDILAPLHQCCYLRSTTYAKLLELDLERNGSLSSAVNRLAVQDALFPLLSKEQEEALDKRFASLNDVLAQCFHERGGRENVLL